MRQQQPDVRQEEEMGQTVRNDTEGAREVEHAEMFLLIHEISTSSIFSLIGLQNHTSGQFESDTFIQSPSVFCLSFLCDSCRINPEN